MFESKNREKKSVGMFESKIERDQERERESEYVSVCVKIESVNPLCVSFCFSMLFSVNNEICWTTFLASLTLKDGGKKKEKKKV